MSNHSDSSIKLKVCCELKPSSSSLFIRFIKYYRSYNIEHEKYFIQRAFGTFNHFFRNFMKAELAGNNICMPAENVV